MAGSSSPYRRVLLKLSGEALMGPAAYGIHVPAVQRLSGEIRDAMASGVEWAGTSTVSETCPVMANCMRPLPS